MFIAGCHAQISLSNERYFLSPSIINPAFSGSEYYPVINLSYRKQWVGFSDSPNSQLISGDFRLGQHDFYTPKKFLNKSGLISRERMGIGVAITNSVNGPIQNLDFMINYAYHIPFKRSRLGFGLSVDLGQWVFDESILEPYDPSDPGITYLRERQFTLNSGFGIVYYSPTFFAGFSAKEFFNTAYKATNNVAKEDLFLMGGYKYSLRRLLDIEPSATLKLLDQKEFRYDIHLKLYYQKFNWLCFSYKSYKAVVAQLGLKISRFTLAYAYEIDVGEVAGFQSGSHQISVGKNLGLRGVEGVLTTRKPNY